MKIKSPKTVKAVRTEARGRCELLCGRAALHVHHEPARTHVGDIRPGLIALCFECHNKADDSPMRRKIIEAICRREKCSAADREAVVFLLKRAPKEAGKEWFLSQVLIDEVLAEGWSTAAVELLDKTLTEGGR